jgi:hypothetical protein
MGYHGIIDYEILHRYYGKVHGGYYGGTTKHTKQLIIKEREIGYRITLHQHPFVQALTQRLLQSGTEGLLGADTDYADGRASLPGSVELEFSSDTTLHIQAGARISLNHEITVSAGDATLQLSPGMDLRIGGSGRVKGQWIAPVKAALLDGLAETPAEGEIVVLTDEAGAVAAADSYFKLASNTPVVMVNGESVSLPAGSEVILPGGTRVLLEAGTRGTLRKSKRLPKLFEDFFAASYQPTRLVKHPYPVKDLDFSYNGAYAVYNWELFFHVPLTIAIHLSKNGRYAEAQKWFHTIFDPTDDSEGPTPERFWKVRPFQTTDVRKIEEILVNLAAGSDPALREETISAISRWQANPFRPHAIARYRQQAYMVKTVTAYLDNLIAWGDALFRQDTGEAIDEALMLYILAAQILGPRPQAVPAKGKVRPRTYHDLKSELKQFGTVLREIEAELPFDLMPLPPEGAEEDGRLAAIRSMGRTLYFGIPRNEKLLAYWDTVADRLFKIRNSLNFQGVFRQLALFEPPIDPGMLARAAAAGLDVGAVISGMNQPLPLVRFAWLIQKAAEVVQEVKSMGASLLAAMEKEDGEALAVLRAKHERVIMELVENVRYNQLQEAVKSTESLKQSLALAVQRYTFYELQLGRSREDIARTIEDAVAALGELDRDGLAARKFDMTEPVLPLRNIEVDIASDVFAQAAGALSGGKLLSSHEAREILLLEMAQVSADAASVLNVASAAAAVVPQFTVSAQPWGVGGMTSFGGQNVASAINAYSNAARGIADRLNFEARRVNRMDAFARREREWAFQSNLAAGEINQIFRQLRAAQLREAIAEQELNNHRMQMKHAAEIERFLNAEGTEKNGKTTNRSLYAWMKREIKGLYAQCFQLAYEIAKKAERALQHELGKPELTCVQSGYLTGKEGLLAGEKLYLDIRRMEMAYHELNHREYELTKHVSLLQADPLALVQLRTTGRCTVQLPEALFDLDGPGHYFRRIKNVSVSIPCVTGPYTGVNCTLTLLKSSIRTKPTLIDEVYARTDAGDDRFSDYYGSMQSIVTSSAQNDSGMFEVQPRDERYLPFENAGVISEWQLSLPADPSQHEPCQFDYDTISDVILHIRYTAREGGELLRSAAKKHLKDCIKEAKMAGSVRLFSARREFPAEWSRFKNQEADGDRRYEMNFKLRPEHYPFWSMGRLNRVERIDVLARSSAVPAPNSLDVFASRETAVTAVIATLAREGNLLRGSLKKEALPAKPDGELALCFDTNELSDVWFALTWGE